MLKAIHHPGRAQQRCLNNRRIGTFTSEGASTPQRRMYGLFNCDLYTVAEICNEGTSD